MMKQKNSKFKSVISLLLALIMMMSATNVFAQTEVQESNGKMQLKIPEILYRIQSGEDYIRESIGDGNYTSWWDALASGEDFVGDETKAAKVVFPEIKDTSKINDYINAIMMSNVTGLNLEQAGEWGKKLTSMQKEDGAFGTLLNQHIFAMIALNYNHQPYDVDAAIDRMMNWIIETDGIDTDYVALAIIALYSANTPNRPLVQGYMKLLAQSLQQAKRDGGYFSAWTGVNTNTTACAVAALGLAGESASNYELFNMQLPDGSFKFLKSDEKGNHMATQQAIISLKISYADYNDETIMPKISRAEDKTVSISVQGASGEILYIDSFTVDVTKATDPNAGLTYEDVIRQALEAYSIPYDIQQSPYGGNYIASINNEAEGSFGGYDGWLCLQNGQSLPTSFSTVYVENNDLLTVYYGDFSLTKLLNLELESKVATVGEDAVFAVTTTEVTYEDKYDENGYYIPPEVYPVAGVKIEAFGKTYTSDAEGKIVVPGKDIKTAGMIEIKLTKWQEGAVPGAVAMRTKVCVTDSNVDSLDIVGVKKVKFIKKKIKVKVGNKATLRVKLTPEKGLEKAAKKVKWSIDKKGKKVVKFVKKAKALNGKLKAVIKAKKKGTAKVTCTAPSGKKATCTIKVVKKK